MMSFRRRAARQARAVVPATAQSLESRTLLASTLAYDFTPGGSSQPHDFVTLGDAAYFVTHTAIKRRSRLRVNRHGTRNGVVAQRRHRRRYVARGRRPSRPRERSRVQPRVRARGGSVVLQIASGRAGLRAVGFRRHTGRHPLDRRQCQQYRVRVRGRRGGRPTRLRERGQSDPAPPRHRPRQARLPADRRRRRAGRPLAPCGTAGRRRWKRRSPASSPAATSAPAAPSAWASPSATVPRPSPAPTASGPAIKGPRRTARSAAAAATLRNVLRPHVLRPRR